ncbi:hypothetical protein [Collimonas sp.]|jgi:hypothetical protein|uniref:hypothetical protein n=1 Tax=Collimonas sp. TaxID=1963772 RepID=UPI002CBD1D7F|nr:hypothetical protein [Collimonas sp.]HWW07935.1 hypothetical protein [Collimonas sp.]
MLRANASAMIVADWGFALDEGDTACLLMNLPSTMHEPELLRAALESMHDQSVARTAAINSNIAASNALSVIGKQMGLPEAATTLLSNAGAIAGLSYKVIGGTWQAEGAHCR